MNASSCRNCEYSHWGWGEYLCRHPKTFNGRKKKKSAFEILNWGDRGYEWSKEGICKGGKKYEKRKPFRFVRTLHKVFTCQKI